MIRSTLVLCIAVLTATGQARNEPGSARACPPDETPIPVSRPLPAPDEGLEQAIAVQGAFAGVARKLFPCVVTIRTYVRDERPEGARVLDQSGWVMPDTTEDYPGYRLNAAGSGFVVSEDGDILTCLHHLQTPEGKIADIIDVETPDQRHIISSLVGSEPSLNFAILRFAVYSEGYPPSFGVARLGNSASIQSGHWAFGVGDPAGPEKYFSVGMFTTGPSRDCYQELLTAFYLQTAMTAHPQAYGGPLVNIHGEVMGMLSPRKPAPGPRDTVKPTGLEFALPSNVIQGLYKAIKIKGSMRSPWLGLSVISRAELIKKLGVNGFKELTRPRFGIQLENTFEPGPATRAGLKPGDWMVRFDGAVINSPLDFQKKLYLAGIGAKVKLEIFRDGETRTVEIEIEERPENAIQR